MRPKALLFIALFNSILGLSVLFPILAPLGRQLGLGELEVGALSTGYSLMQFLSAAYWGRKSEEKGRKPVLLVGIIGFAVTFLLFALVCEAGLRGWLDHYSLFGLLLATRLFGGLLSSATFPTAQAYMADITDREDRTSGMALIGAAFGLGIIFGPAIGGFLSRWGYGVPGFAAALRRMGPACSRSLRGRGAAWGRRRWRRAEVPALQAHPARSPGARHGDRGGAGPRGGATDRDAPGEADRMTTETRQLKRPADPSPEPCTSHAKWRKQRWRRRFGSWLQRR